MTFLFAGGWKKEFFKEKIWSPRKIRKFFADKNLGKQKIRKIFADKTWVEDHPFPGVWRAKLGKYAKHQNAKFCQK